MAATVKDFKSTQDLARVQQGVRDSRLLRSPIRELEETPTSEKFVFPSNLADIDHYVNFRVIKEYRFGRRESSIDETLYTIYLPIPAALQTGYKNNYANEAMGMLAGTAANITAGTNRAGQTDLANVGAGLLTKLTEPATTGLVTGVLANAAGGGGAASTAAGVAAAGGAAVAKGVMAGMGVAANPHMAILFSGVDFRSHQFTYRLMPRNQRESEDLTDLITRLKYHAAPELIAGSHIFQYPETFDIEFHHGTHLFNIGTSVMTDLQVNYHPNGQPEYFIGEGGQRYPVSVELSMTFQEITITTKEEIALMGR